MGFLVPLTLFGWIPFVLALFALLPPRRAVVTAFLAAWLFLPMAGYGVKGLPDYTKMSATAPFPVRWRDRSIAVCSAASNRSVASSQVYRLAVA